MVARKLENNQDTVRKNIFHKNYKLMYIIYDCLYKNTILLSKRCFIFRTTNEDGRMGDFIDCEDFGQGIYKMVFNTKPYFTKANVTTFYPYVEVILRYLCRKYSKSIQCVKYISLWIFSLNSLLCLKGLFLRSILHSTCHLSGYCVM